MCRHGVCSRQCHTLTCTASGFSHPSELALALAQLSLRFVPSGDTALVEGQPHSKINVLLPPLAYRILSAAIFYDAVLLLAMCASHQSTHLTIHPVIPYQNHQ